MQPYLKSILTAVFDSSVDHGVSGIDAVVDSKTAVPLGLIINELATNAVKHGFTDPNNRRFTVDIGNDPEKVGYVGLTVKNSGRPVPLEIDIASPDTLGLRLISSLADQLHSRLSLTRGEDTTFTFDVPVLVSEAPISR